MKITDINHPRNLWMYPLENRLHVLFCLTAEAEELGMDERTANGWRWVIQDLIQVAEELTNYKTQTEKHDNIISGGEKCTQ